MSSRLSAHDSLDGVTWQRVEKHGHEENQADPEEDLEDGPLVIVPDDITN